MASWLYWPEAASGACLPQRIARPTFLLFLLFVLLLLLLLLVQCLPRPSAIGHLHLANVQILSYIASKRDRAFSHSPDRKESSPSPYPHNIREMIRIKVAFAHEKKNPVVYRWCYLDTAVTTLYKVDSSPIYFSQF